MFESLFAAVLPVMKDLLWAAAGMALTYMLQQIPISIQLIMTQITQAKLKDLNILKLYEHYDALEKSLPLTHS
jgi:hypothetical protein